MQKVSPIAQWIFPSIKDVLFLAYLFIPLLIGQSGVLNDADTGWHIRNGDQILQTGQLPTTDSFSYTHAGKTWFAWEWLADVWLALVHQWMGLNGIALWANLTFALTFTLLFRWILAWKTHLLITLSLVALASLASTIHWLARPHLFSMFFLLVWQIILNRVQNSEDSKKILWILPLLILVWVNLHGAFVVGLVHLLIFTFGNYLTSLTSSDQVLSNNARRLSWQFAKLTVICGLASLINPYGWRLYQHIIESYLQSQFLVDKITEFASPDFHSGGVKFFEAILLICIIMLAICRERLTFIEIGLLIFWIHLSLFSVRHIPLATLVVTPIAAHHLSRFFFLIPNDDSIRPWIANSIEIINRYAQTFLRFECQFKGYVYPSIALAVTIAICFNQGKLGERKIFEIGFNPKLFPVKASSFIEEKQFQGNLFTTDSWGGYMIYRFFPHHKVFFDGRSDMYGRTLIQDYEDLVKLKHSWNQLLEKYAIRWILLPSNYGMATALKESNAWQVIYDDQHALIFVKKPYF